MKIQETVGGRERDGVLHRFEWHGGCLERKGSWLMERERRLAIWLMERECGLGERDGIWLMEREGLCIGLAIITIIVGHRGKTEEDNYCDDSKDEKYDVDCDVKSQQTNSSLVRAINAHSKDNLHAKTSDQCDEGQLDKRQQIHDG